MSCSSQIREVAASQMFFEDIVQLAPSELAKVEESIAPYKFDSGAKQLFLRAVVIYEIEYFNDDPLMRENIAELTNNGRRKLLELIIKLCDEGAPSSEIENACNRLSRWDHRIFGSINKTDPEKLKGCRESLLAEVPKRGPTARQARRYFIRNLYEIFVRTTGRLPGRSVHDGEKGDFLLFVKAALEPFKATQGCEADIKAVLREIKKQNASSAK